MKILAVDDDAHFLDVLSAVLGEAGYNDVTCVDSADAALEFAERSEAEIDCFLLDVAMPDIDGVELCQSLREMKRYRATPIIMVTALHQKALVRECFDAGATDFLNKPLDGLELGARIRAARLLNDSLKHGHHEEPGEFSVLSMDEMAWSEAAHLNALQDIHGLTNSHAIENHMLRNRAGYYILHVLSFELRGFKALADTLSPRECNDVLVDAALTIARSMDNYEFSFSHLGGGRFISLVQGRRFWSTENVIEEISATLSAPRLNAMTLQSASLEVASLSDRKFWTATQAADAIRAHRNESAQMDATIRCPAEVQLERHVQDCALTEF